MIPAELLTECRKLALTVAPELSAAPLYIVDMADCPWLAPTSCCGFAVDDSIDCNMREVIGDQWQGPGPFIAIGTGYPGIAADELRHDTLLVMTHELGHIVPAKPVVDMSEYATPQYREFLAKSFNDGMRNPAPSEHSPDDHHDLNYCRRTSHLFVRALEAGYDLRAENLFRRPWQSREEFYIGAVLHEALKMRELPFAQIEQEPPPAWLVKGWESDLRWFKHFHQKEQQQ